MLLAVFACGAVSLPHILTSEYRENNVHERKPLKEPFFAIGSIGLHVMDQSWPFQQADWLVSDHFGRFPDIDSLISVTVVMNIASTCSCCGEVAVLFPARAPSDEVRDGRFVGTSLCLVLASFEEEEGMSTKG